MKDLVFKDFGIPVKYQETRSSVISMDGEGNIYLVIFTRGSLLNIDLKKEKYTQVFFPQKDEGYPFRSFCAVGGKVYTGSGPMFLEFDPKENAFTHHARVDNVHISAFILEEDKDGNILFGSYSDTGCRLFSYNPKSKNITDFGPMDEYAMYMDWMARDEFGWVYMSMGTEKKNIVGYELATGKRISYLEDGERTRGSAYVQRDAKGMVCGHFDSEDVGYGFVKGDLNPDKKWYKFEKGEMIEISHTRVEPSSYYYGHHSFDAIHSPFYRADTIFEHQISEGFVKYINPATGKTTQLKLEYETRGANLSPMVMGPDGLVYGTSNHPMQGYTFNPKTGEIINYGNDFYEDGGGGNVCAYAVLGDMIGGAAYYGGKVHILDTGAPFIPGLNPKLVARHKEILRPRSAVANERANCFVFGGFGENGSDGGGLYFYYPDRKGGHVLKNEEVIRYHNTMCMLIDDRGNLIGGTSTHAPCGGIPKVTEAKIYYMDWETKRVVEEYVPVGGAEEISLMKMDDGGLLHGFTSDSQYFIFNMGEGKTEYLADLSPYGSVVRDGLFKGGKNLLYGIMSKAVFTINTKTGETKLVGTPPKTITAGIAVNDYGIYFGCGSKLCGFIR